MEEEAQATRRIGSILAAMETMSYMANHFDKRVDPRKASARGKICDQSNV